MLPAPGTPGCFENVALGTFFTVGGIKNRHRIDYTKTTYHSRTLAICEPGYTGAGSSVKFTVNPGAGPCNDDCVDNGPGRPAGAPCTGCGGKVAAGELLP